MGNEGFGSFFRDETARVRTLTSECRRLGIFLEDIPEELVLIRGLLHDGHLDEALTRIRELKLELLARLLLYEPMESLPGEVENPPSGTP